MATADGGGSSRTDILTTLETVLRDRLVDAPDGSYSVTLLRDPERAARKITEEAFELCVELVRASVDHERVASEAADLLFHVLAGVVGAGSSLAEVLTELDARRPDTAAGASPAGEGRP